MARPATAAAPEASRAERAAAARARRRAERAEVRRFTRRSRSRRIGFAIAGALLASIVGMVFVAVFSPLLALRTVMVDGTSRLDPAAVAASVSDQVGTPLALIDFSKITAGLESFPLIRSYVTQIVPPDTLVIHVVERQPVGQLPVANGFRLVDPAGVTVQESEARVAGVPLIDLGGQDTTSVAFSSTVEVLLALPPELLAQVDTIIARTQDDVSLVLTGVGQRVQWGSADESARKATLLAALIRITDPSLAGEFDVSAPSNGIFRPS